MADRSPAFMLPAGGGEHVLALVKIENFACLALNHGAGAAATLLRVIEQRLARWALPPDAARLRFAEDEFPVMLNRAGGQDAILREGAALLHQAASPVAYRGETLVPSVRLGVAPLEAACGSLRDAVFAARLAIAGPPGGSRSKVHVCTPSLLARALRRQRLEADLPGAIASGQVIPYYQPVVDLRTGRITGLEALARWQHPEEGLIGPDVFVPIVESLSLCCQMTVSLMAQAARDSRNWPRDWRYAFNISPSELATLLDVVTDRDTLPNRLSTPRLVELEVTETALIQDPDLLQRVISTVQPLGVSVALDDFGTGYANFQHLRSVPFSRLKVDKSFVTHMLEDRRTEECARAIVSLAHCLGMTATAEGVETEEVARALAGMRCDHAQGYFFSRPQPAQVIDYLTERSVLGDTPPALWSCLPDRASPNCAEAAD